MVPILTTTLKSDKGFDDAHALRAYLDGLIDSQPALLPYRYALIDVWENYTGDSRIEIYERPETGDDRILVLWLPDHRRAGIKVYSRGDWQWTMAANPQDALLRFRDGRMLASGFSRS